MSTRSRFYKVAWLVLLLGPLTGLAGTDGYKSTCPPPTVDVGYATYIGFTNHTTGLNHFRGIQYAAAPIGDLRWQKPQPPPTQTSTVTLTTAFPSECPQTPAAPLPPSPSWSGNEDCLYLSVVTPSGARDLPVLVLIHGGGYGSGAGNTEFIELIQNNGNGFIFVTIQYRLGAFGFLSSAALMEEGIANAGLWDQHAALQWIQAHIKKFGGDPNRITISGESAGAGSVMTLVMGEGGAWGTSLFQNAIAASPYLPAQYEFDGPFPESTFAAFATAAGCLDEASPTENSTIIACLRASNTTNLQRANQQANSMGRYGTWSFVPVTEGDFLQHRPSVQLLGKKVNGARILTSNNADEGPAFVPPGIKTVQDFDTWLADLLPLMNKHELYMVADLYAIDPVIRDAPLFATRGNCGPTALNQSSFAVGQLQRATNLWAETTIVCPSYWLATSFGRPMVGGQAWHCQFSVPPAEHGADVDAYYLADAISPGNGTMTESFRRGVQLIWGNFIINNTPILSRHDIATLAGINGNSGAFDAAGSDKWTRWTGGTTGSSMLNLNMTGGVEIQVEMGYAYGTAGSVTVTQYSEPGLAAAWSLADGYKWEGDRGARCEAWAAIGHLVPE